MYRFASDLNLDDLVGTELQQICLGPTDVQFRFGSGTCIALQSRATLVTAGLAQSEWTASDGWSNHKFQLMLHSPVREYVVLSERLLEIRFTNDLALQLHDDFDQFESLQIYPGGDVVDQIVV
ncbi:hypothetical protein ACHMW6_24110 [Pseudoduganella sp. UC29_106]|uniref:hypothetical protein n=1 Tax=Pseudoduganella sp. UC29_106 TaxID=3374553 RepID=UPI003756B6A0